MIVAVIFDLNGTLVGTEKLKALSNAFDIIASRVERGMPAPEIYRLVARESKGHPKTTSREEKDDANRMEG